MKCGWCLIKCSSDFSCSVLFWRYLRSKLSKIAPNFWRCSPCQILLGAPLQNLYPRYHAYLAVCRLVTFHRIIATSPKVIETFVMNFKLIFECSRVNFWGTPSQFGVCARQPWSISSACKNLRSQHPQLGRKFSLLNNVHLGGLTRVLITFLLVDQSSPNFFRSIREGVAVDFRSVYPFQRYLWSVVKNCAKF